MTQPSAPLLMTRTWLARCSALCVAVAIFCLALPSASHAKYASFVMEADTGKVLHSVNADTRNYPASLTKMMTLYMLFEALDRGKLKETDRLKVSHRAARQPASHLALRARSTIRVKDAIKALAIKSANDVAVVIAESLGGTERKFARMMTAKAKQIGMNSTVFRNASGLPHRAQMSTARDMAKLGLRLMRDYPHYYHYFSDTKFTYDGRTHKSHNKLLKTYKGVDGIKTGYIRASGFNLVTSAERDGKRVIGVVFGARSAKARNRHMASLLNKGFTRLGVVQPVPKKAKTRTATSYAVQVGAFARVKQAYSAAHKALAAAPSYLSDGEIMIAQLKRKKKNPLYRARIVGLSKREAYRACRVLKKKARMGCMEMKIKKSVQLASAR